MRRHANMEVVAAIALGLVPSCSRAAPADAPKGKIVNSYDQRAAVTAVTLTAAGSVADALGGLVAVAPDGKRWALATLAAIRLFDGDRETRVVQLANEATAIRFSADGKALRVGPYEVDAATGAVTTATGPADLAGWVARSGLTAPAALGLGAIAVSSDGALIVGGASDAAFDREGPMRPVPGVDRHWLIALDGQWQPRTVMWHGTGAVTQVAIGDHFIAAGAGGSIRIFARDAPGKQLVASPFIGTIGVAWAPGDALLAAVGDGKRVAVWRAGAWASPAAAWTVGAGYQAAVAFHPARPVLAAANHDGHLRLYGVADAQLGAPPLLLDQDLGGDIRGMAFSADGAALSVAVGPPAGKVVRLTVAATP
jgi:WD40 repeat protein